MYVCVVVIYNYRSSYILIHEHICIQKMNRREEWRIVLLMGAHGEKLLTVHREGYRRKRKVKVNKREGEGDRERDGERVRK